MIVTRHPVAPPRKSGWFARLLPILTVEVYLTSSVVVFAVGPWEYPVGNRGEVVAFVAVAHVALLLGYLVGLRSRVRRYRWRWSAERLLKVASVVSIVLIFPTSLLNTGNLIPNVIEGIRSTGEVYERYQYLRIADTPYAAYVRMFVGPLLAMPVPLTVFYWRQLRGRIRLLGITAILGNVCLFIAMGVNQGVAIPVVLTAVTAVAGMKAGRLRPRRWQRASMAMAVLIVAWLALSFFRSTALQRAGSSAVTGTFEQINIVVDRDHFMLRGLSDSSQVLVLGLTGYVGQGYYGLALAMRKPFVPMFGVGHSTFLYRQLARISGDQSLEHLAYPERISDEDGWTVVRFFQTIYPWFASDVTFPGAILVVMLIGYLLGRLWLDVLQGDNPFAVSFLAPLSVMLLYFPALNAQLQGGEGITTFWGLLLLWLLSSRRFVLRPRQCPPA